MNWKELFESPNDRNKNKSFQEYLAAKKVQDTADYREQRFYERAPDKVYKSPNQEFADIRGVNLYRVEFNGQWANVWAHDEKEAHLYVLDNYCLFTGLIILNTTLLVKSNTQKGDK